MSGHDSPTTRRFVRTAWILLSFQLVASLGAGAAAIWAASSVRHLADERDALQARVAELEARPAAALPAPPPEAQPQLVPDTIEIPAGPALRAAPPLVPAPTPVRPIRTPPRIETPVRAPPITVPPPVATPIVPPVVQPEDSKPPNADEPRPRPRRPRISIDIPSLFSHGPRRDTPTNTQGNPGRPSTNGNGAAAPQAAQPARPAIDPRPRRRPRTDPPQQDPLR